MCCREAALELLKRGWPLGEESKYDTNHALVLCRMHGFTSGLRFLYERMRHFREVLQVEPLGLPCLLCTALSCVSTSCAAPVLPLCCPCVASVLPVCCPYAAPVLPLCCPCAAPVSPLRCPFAAPVLPMGCPCAMLLLYQDILHCVSYTSAITSTHVPSPPHQLTSRTLSQLSTTAWRRCRCHCVQCDDSCRCTWQQGITAA